MVERSGGLRSVGSIIRHGSARTMPSGRSAAFNPGGSHAGLGSLLDLNRAGNPLDDVLPMAGKLPGWE
jgi:hypothetical protein